MAGYVSMAVSHYISAVELFGVLYAIMNIHRPIAGSCINDDEVKSILRGAVLAKWRHQCDSFMEKLRKITKALGRVAGVPTEI
jgi:hypothetical protein